MRKWSNKEWKNDEIKKWSLILIFTKNLESPEANPRRTLILISKVLQSWANGVAFSKEAFMISFNNWILANKNKLQEFLDSISDSSNQPQLEDSQAKKISEHDIANLVLFLKHCSNSWKQMEKEYEKQGASDVALLMSFRAQFSQLKEILDLCQ